MKALKYPKHTMSDKLNIDIPGSVATFEAIIGKILPKKFFYRLLLRGRGLEFDGYRNYNQDDDASEIDWKASLRSNYPLVKQYVEEKDIKVMFAIDVSENMIFGGQEKLKCEYAAELAAALASVVIDAGDSFGFALFNKDIQTVILPAKGKNQFDLFGHELSNEKNYGGVCDFNNVLDKLNGMIDKSVTMVILISDFINAGEKNRKKFEEMGNFHETIGIMIRDPLDLTLPSINKEVLIESMDSGQRLIVNPSVAKNLYEYNSKKQIELVKDIFKSSNIDLLESRTDEIFFVKLADFLKTRTERRGFS